MYEWFGTWTVPDIDFYHLERFTHMHTAYMHIYIYTLEVEPPLFFL